MLGKKILLITGAALAGAGLLLCGITYAVFGFDRSKLSTSKFHLRDYTADGDFDNISIKGNTEDISFVLDPGGETKVMCYEEEDSPHVVKVENNTLFIERENKTFWNFGINFEKPTITVYLPESEYSGLKIESDTGDVEIIKEFSFDQIDLELHTGDVTIRSGVKDKISVRTSTGDMDIDTINASALDLDTDTGFIRVTGTKISGDINIKVDTGRAELDDVSCKALYSQGDTGDILLNRVTADGEFHIERSTGDVRFESSDADTVYVRTSTGDVTGSFLTDKVFITDTHTGKTEVPGTSSGGRCEIKTDTGDIRFK
jgi:DUF4097 and DUF4098 domain-containing protein YvlB